jgi:4-hydroxythreonine-4-phosphate dehydrogenase
VIERAAKVAGVDKARLVRVASAAAVRKLRGERGQIGVFAAADGGLSERDAPYGAPTLAAGRAQLAWIDMAMQLGVGGDAGALVTGPVSKHAIAASGGRARSFRGHTEYLAARLGAKEVVMAFWSEKLVVSLVTTHLPIAKVARAITSEGVSSAAFHTAELVRRLGKRTPRVAVSGLNPHAGEQGLLGGEELSRIEPGMVEARERLRRSRSRAVLEGPLGAETAIRKAYAGAYDAVVAMYHDQATIPMKLVGFGDAVNVTLGLPLVRTSVDHGTGYDIAGAGKADPRGMQAALALAVRLAARR